MKTVIIQSLTCLIIFALVWGISFLLIDVIGWFYMYLFVAGYLIFITTTSRYNWAVTLIQFLIVGFLSFVIIGYLYNEVYEPYIEQNYYQIENQIATTIGLFELIIIKLISDIVLDKIGMERKKSMVEKLLLLTKPKKH
jgi:hypothetical protein